MSPPQFLRGSTGTVSKHFSSSIFLLYYFSAENSAAENSESESTTGVKGDKKRKKERTTFSPGMCTYFLFEFDPKKFYESRAIKKKKKLFYTVPC